MSLVVEIVEGPGAGKQIPLAVPLEIGRDVASGLHLADDLVSRRHARLVPRDGTAIAEDLGSTNGTFLNGESIHGPVELKPGDHLLVGVTVLELRSAADVEQRGTAVRPRPPAFARPPATPDYVPASVTGDRGNGHAHRLDPFLDRRTKHQARLAPLGLGLLVALAIVLFLTLR
jgi:hypothetical protein